MRGLGFEGLGFGVLRFRVFGVRVKGLRVQGREILISGIEHSVLWAGFIHRLCVFLEGSGLGR